jgi:ribonuclease J
MINQLYKTGCKVYVNTPEQRIHVSGHAAQTEAQLLVKLINPNYIMPIHGEFEKMIANKNNDLAIGIPPDHVLIVRNGEKVNLLNHVAEISDEILDNYNVFVDGNKINKDSASILKYRQILSSEGIINISIIVNKASKKLLALPVFSTRGSFYAKTANQLITKIVYSIKETLENVMEKKNGNISDEEIKTQVENLTNFYI